jgi:threonyl-tRNA synthetase
MISVQMPNGSEERMAQGTCLVDVARAFAPEGAATTVCAKVDGAICDLRHRLWNDCRLKLLVATSPEGSRVLRHTAAHVVAQAARRIFPSAKLGREPARADRFQVDLEIGSALEKHDLAAIQAEVDRIIADDLPIARCSLSKGDARTWLIRSGEVLKLEILETIEASAVTFYSQGEFSDLCSGPHLLSTGQLPPIRLAYAEEVTWRDEPGAERLARLCGKFAER